MKHLTKQEAIGRMMLAYATLIEEKFLVSLVWYRSFEQLELTIFIYDGQERPQLPILQHTDFYSKEMKSEEGCGSIEYTWDSKTAAL